MWNWIKENSDWLCSVTFGRLPPGIRLIFGILYELFDYALRVVALLIPGFGLVLNGPYLFVAVLLAGSEGIKWGLGDALIGFIPFGDWFPGLSVACFRVWRGYAPDPGDFISTPIQRGGEKMGCLSYSFRIFLTVIFTAASLYFGGQWGYSALLRDYRDQAWEQVKNSPRGIWARGRDSVEGATGGEGEVFQKGTRELKKKIGELSRSLGIGSRSKERRMADARRGKLRQPPQEVQPTTPETAEEQVEKNELLERAKAKKLGLHASELYASETTAKAAEELREKDSAYYQKWFWRLGIPDALLIISLFFFRSEKGISRRRKDYVGLDDDDI